jgi:hypothetical protein
VIKLLVEKISSCIGHECTEILAGLAGLNAIMTYGIPLIKARVPLFITKNGSKSEVAFQVNQNLWSNCN